MFVISLSNQFVTTDGVGGQGPFRTWNTLEEATEAATELNARYGLNAYVHPSDRRDLMLAMINTYDFGYLK